MNALPTKAVFYQAFRRYVPRGLYHFVANENSFDYDSYDLYELSQILYVQAARGNEESARQLGEILKSLHLVDRSQS